MWLIKRSLSMFHYIMRGLRLDQWDNNHKHIRLPLWVTIAWLLRCKLRASKYDRRQYKHIHTSKCRSFSLASTGTSPIFNSVDAWLVDRPLSVFRYIMTGENIESYIVLVRLQNHRYRNVFNIFTHLNIDHVDVNIFRSGLVLVSTSAN